MKLPAIAIIGAGFSGTMALVHLIEQATKPFTIHWFEIRAQVGQGVAYSTQEVIHLLNVRADKIGAFPARPDDFWRWLSSVEGKKCIHERCPEKVFTKDSFVPRLLYGDYLQSILQAALRKAVEKHITTQQHKMAEQVTRTPAGILINNTILAEAVVLATGNLPSERWGLHGAKHYINDVWANDWVAQAKVASHIVIIGTGLTMIDTVLTLKKHGYQGKITAISRGGLLPTVHKLLPTTWPTPQKLPHTAIGLLQFIRAQVRAAKKQTIDWRSVIDSLRPVTATHWQSLPLPEKKKIIRRLLTFWSIHRHRMAPEIAEQIDELRKSGQLKILSARIENLLPKENGIEVQAVDKKARAHTLHADLLLNCMGPELLLQATKNPLLAQLRDAKLITPSATGLGVVMDEASNIFPVGTLLVGELLECTAVPELREQIVKCVNTLTKYINTLGEKK